MDRYSATLFTCCDGHFYAEASELGWPPGKYLREFYIEREPFNLVGVEEVDDEIFSWNYTNKHGVIAIITND